MAIANIRLYGADTDVSGSPIITTKTNVEALSGVQYWDVEAYFVNAGVEDETEVNEYLNFFKSSKNNYRVKYEIQSKPDPFPTSTTSITTQYPFLNVIDKKYLWIWLNDYPITCYNTQSTNVMRVYKDSSMQIETDSGRKTYSLTLYEMKQNREHT